MCTPQLCEFCSFCSMFCAKTIETEKFSVWRAGVSTVIESKEDLAHGQKFSRNFIYNFSVFLEASRSNGIFVPDHSGFEF